MKLPRLNSSQTQFQCPKFELRLGEKARTSNSTDQQPSFAPNGSSQMAGQVKNRVDPKFFDPDKGAQCFLCWEWGHDCEQKVCNNQRDSEGQHFEPNAWSTVEGLVGFNKCYKLLDSGAETSMVKSDLVPRNAHLGYNVKAKGVEWVMRE